MSPRTLRIVLPLLAFVAAAFALYQLFLGGMSLRTHAYPYAALYLVMGIAGLAIANGLWRTSKGPKN